MTDKPASLPVRPKDLEWLAEALKLSEALSEAPALESLLQSFPAISLEDWPAGADILREGERGEDFFVVYRGRLSVWRRAAEAPAREIGSLAPGDFFGELGYLLKSARSATVRADSQCRVFRFPVQEFAALLKRFQVFELWVKQVAYKRIERMFFDGAR